MHGQPGGWTDAYRSGKLDEMADKLIADGEMPPSIMVAFDGNGPEGLGGMTNFCNRADGYRTEDFIVKGLVPYMDATYRTIPNTDNWAIWGYSSGGYGALNVGFKNPGVFHVLASQTGFYQPQDDKGLMIRVLGKPGNPRWNANDPTLTVQSFHPVFADRFADEGLHRRQPQLRRLRRFSEHRRLAQGAWRKRRNAFAR